MAKKKKSSGGGGGADWMGTYGDMVTLLLCFFVLLYSMSTMDSSKWEIIVKSFNPDAAEVSQIVTDQTLDEANNDVSGSSQPEEYLDEFEDLYYHLKEYIEEKNLQDEVLVEKGEGFTFITFSNSVFFDGDSYFLRSEGKAILDDVTKAIGSVSDTIKEVQILGHTSQANPYEPNNVRSDRFLSSNRATEVLVYMQQYNVIDPTKLVSSGYGQFRPVSSFETAESRAENRRVEVFITKDNTDIKGVEDYRGEITEDSKSGEIIEVTSDLDVEEITDAIIQ